jgi:hypothetical protein
VKDGDISPRYGFTGTVAADKAQIKDGQAKPESTNTDVSLNDKLSKGIDIDLNENCICKTPFGNSSMKIITVC